MLSKPQHICMYLSFSIMSSHTCMAAQGLQVSDTREEGELKSTQFNRQFWHEGRGGTKVYSKLYLLTGQFDNIATLKNTGSRSPTAILKQPLQWVAIHAFGLAQPLSVAWCPPPPLLQILKQRQHDHFTWCARAAASLRACASSNSVAASLIRACSSGSNLIINPPNDPWLTSSIDTFTVELYRKYSHFDRSS